MGWNVLGCLCVPAGLAAGMPSVRQEFWNGRSHTMAPASKFAGVEMATALISK